MALTPVPYTDNWFDTFGSQVAPIGQAAKTAPIVIVAPVALAGQVVTINRTHALAMVIDWADGSPVEVHAAGGGVKTHTYNRPGNYRIRSRVTSQPDVLIDEQIRVTTRPDGTFTIEAHDSEPNGIKLDITGAIFPVTIQWGDGDSRYEQFDTGIIYHTYPAAGSYVVEVHNAAAQVFRQSITVPLAVEDPELQFSPPYPWVNLGVGPLNDWIEELDIEVPSQWFQWTLPVKKAWLVEHHGNG